MEKRLKRATSPGRERMEDLQHAQVSGLSPCQSQSFMAGAWETWYTLLLHPHLSLAIAMQRWREQRAIGKA
jgi:hypothetical protein